MIDHDQRFEEMLREFWWELVALFLPWLARSLAGRAIEWKRQDVFTNPPFGLVRRVDLLGAVIRKLSEEQSAEHLLHVEVESAGSLTEVRKKIGYYYPGLRTIHNLPVTTLAVYLKVGKDGMGWDEYVEDEAEGEGQLYRVRWRYVGLPALPAEEYLTSGNWLGVALSALMRIDRKRKPWLRAEILRRLATECDENDYRKLLLINIVETYLPMEGEQQAAYDLLVSQNPKYQEATNMILTTYDRGVADGERKGETKGELKALRVAVIKTAMRRCGTVDEDSRKKLDAIEDVAHLERLFDAAFTAQSWEQLLATS